jgi:hypothetical protein
VQHLSQLLPKFVVRPLANGRAGGTRKRRAVMFWVLALAALGL